MHQQQFSQAAVYFRSVLNGGHRVLLGSKTGFRFGGHTAIVLAGMICVQSASASNMCEGNFFDFCCYTLQPGTFTVCEDVDQNQEFKLMAVFHANQSDEELTSWQWFRTVNGVETAVSGAYGIGWTATLPIYGWSPPQVGEYRCQFFEEVDPNGGISCGISNSDYGSYRVQSAARITGVPPADQTICSGETASFHVQGTNVAYYRWFKVGSNQTLEDGQRANGTVISGSETPTLTISNAHASDNVQGQYRCTVGGISGGAGGDPIGCGTSTSATARLTIVTGAATITSEASAKTVCRGENASFTVGASGQDVTYQWYKRYESSGVIVALSEGNALLEQTVFSGTTTNKLSLTNVGTQAAGPYFCRVTNFCGTEDSAEAKLVVGSISVNVTNIKIDLNSNIPDTVCTINSGLVYISVQTKTDPPGATLYYQWYKRGASATNFSPIAEYYQNNGTYITGTKTFQITLGELGQLHNSDTGDYRCVISTNPTFPDCDVAESPPKTLTVTSLGPEITLEPLNQQICVGSDATFSISAERAQKYTWFRSLDLLATGEKPLTNGTLSSGTVVEGADTPTLVLRGVQSADIGTYYRCFVENACSLDISAYKLLYALPAPVITSPPPASLSVCIGKVAVLSVGATGDNLAYQWTRNNVDLVNNDTYSNVNTPTLAVLIDSAFAQANFRCRITSNLCSTASVTSSATSLSRTNPITITNQPSPVVLCGTGGSANFSLTATGTNPKTYQWRKNGVAVLNGPGVTGATTDTLKLTSITQAAMGYYRCTVTNSCGEETSDSAGLSVIDTSAPFTTQPTPQSICGVGTVTFSVVAAGLPDLGTTYRWQRRLAGGGFTNLSDGSGISGSLTSTLTLTDADAGDLADYRCRATNDCGTFNSAVAALTMDTLATIDTPPVSQTVCNGNTAVFSVQASGPNLTYRWQSRQGTQGFLNLSDGARVSGAFTNTLTITNVDDIDAKIYRCRATNTCGTVASDPATLTVAVPVAADLDGDCDVDSNDFAVFKSCASGPGIPFVDDCAKADFDDNGDVDMDDFAIFQRCYSGPGMPANPNCVN